MPEGSELQDASPHLPHWAQTGATLPDGRIAYYAEILCTPGYSVGTHQFSGTVPTVVLELSPDGIPVRLTHAEAHTIAAALLTAAVPTL
jgi:hypothetical protein